MEGSPRTQSRGSNRQLQTSPVVSPRKLPEGPRVPSAPVNKPPTSVTRPMSARSRMQDGRRSKGAGVDVSSKALEEIVSPKASVSRFSVQSGRSCPPDSQSLHRMLTQFWTQREEMIAMQRRLELAEDRVAVLSQENSKLHSALQRPSSAACSLDLPNRLSSVSPSDRSVPEVGFVPVGGTSPKQERDSPRRRAPRSAGPTRQRSLMSDNVVTVDGEAPASPRASTSTNTHSSVGLVGRLKEQLEVYRHALAQRERELLLAQSAQASVAPHSIEHEDANLTFRREIQRLQGLASQTKADLVKEITERNGLEAALKDTMKEKDKLASQLEAVTVERDELVLTMKRIVRSTLTVGQAVEVLLPDCPEGSEFGTIVQMNDVACLIQFVTGSQSVVDKHSVFSRADDVPTASPDDEDHDDNVNPWRVAQLLEHRCALLSGDNTRLRQHVEQLAAERMQLEDRLRRKESAVKDECDSHTSGGSDDEDDKLFDASVSDDDETNPPR